MPSQSTAIDTELSHTLVRKCRLLSARVGHCFTNSFPNTCTEESREADKISNMYCTVRRRNFLLLLLHPSRVVTFTVKWTILGPLTPRIASQLTTEKVTFVTKIPPKLGLPSPHLAEAGQIMSRIELDGENFVATFCNPWPATALLIVLQTRSQHWRQILVQDPRYAAPERDRVVLPTSSVPYVI